MIQALEMDRLIREAGSLPPDCFNEVLDFIGYIKSKRNAKYIKMLEESRQELSHGKTLTFAMEDLDAFADGLLNKDQLREKALYNA